MSDDPNYVHAHGHAHGHESHGHHKFDPANVARLESAERLAWLRPAELLAHVGVRAGMLLADVGCGSGFFTRPAAAIVGPQGHVFGMDPSAEMLQACRERGVPYNVELLQSGESVLPLADASVQFVFLGFVLHEAASRSAFSAELRRILKPGGRLASVDWVPQHEEHGPPTAHRILEADAVAVFARAGFVDVRCERWTESHYVVTGGV